MYHETFAYEETDYINDAGQAYGDLLYGSTGALKGVVALGATMALLGKKDTKALGAVAALIAGGFLLKADTAEDTAGFGDAYDEEEEGAPSLSYASDPASMRYASSAPTMRLSDDGEPEVVHAGGAARSLQSKLQQASVVASARLPTWRRRKVFDRDRRLARRKRVGSAVRGARSTARYRWDKGVKKRQSRRQRRRSTVRSWFSGPYGDMGEYGMTRAVRQRRMGFRDTIMPPSEGYTGPVRRQILGRRGYVTAWFWRGTRVKRRTFHALARRGQGRIASTASHPAAYQAMVAAADVSAPAAVNRRLAAQSSSSVNRRIAAQSAPTVVQAGMVNRRLAAQSQNRRLSGIELPGGYTGIESGGGYFADMGDMGDYGIAAATVVGSAMSVRSLDRRIARMKSRMSRSRGVRRRLLSARIRRLQNRRARIIGRVKRRATRRQARGKSLTQRQSRLVSSSASGQKRSTASKQARRRIRATLRPPSPNYTGSVRGGPRGRVKAWFINGQRVKRTQYMAHLATSPRAAPPSMQLAVGTDPVSQAPYAQGDDLQYEEGVSVPASSSAFQASSSAFQASGGGDEDFEDEFADSGSPNYLLYGGLAAVMLGGGYLFMQKGKGKKGKGK